MVKPLPDDELANHLHSAALHLLRRVARADAASGVSPARLSALSMLVFGGARTIGALAQAEGVTPPTMTRLVAGLERDGLVTRATSADDRRAVVITATGAARRLLVDGRERRLAELVGLLATTSKGDRRALTRASAVIERMVGTGPAPREGR
jgi:DNA-binding MarR family transcriptional regulator